MQTYQTPSLYAVHQHQRTRYKELLFIIHLCLCLLLPRTPHKPSQAKLTSGLAWLEIFKQAQTTPSQADLRLELGLAWLDDF